MTGIYCITCNKTNEKYIGQSVSIKRRWATHKRELKDNIHYNITGKQCQGKTKVAPIRNPPLCIQLISAAARIFSLSL